MTASLNSSNASNASLCPPGGWDNSNDARDDAMWIITSSFIIFTMQSGFGLLESGSVSAKSEVNIMVKNVVDVVFGGLLFWACGYGIIFGDSVNANGFVGVGKFFLDADSGESVGTAYASFFFQLSFSTTAATIVSGSMVERTKLHSYILVSTFTILVHSFAAHWVWSADGFLGRWGVVDVAGAGPVHLVGGCVGLVSTLILRPRLGRFGPDGRAEISSPTNALLGTFMLWWGWLGFNCGSTWGITKFRWHMAARSAVSTIMASVGGGAMAIFASYAVTRKCKIDFLINGILASLVSITALCAYARPWYSIIVGAVGAGMAVSVAPVLEWLWVDDPVGVIPVHLVSSVWSLLSVGLFAEPDQRQLEAEGEGAPGLLREYGLFFGGGWVLLGRQAAAVLAIAAWATVLPALFIFCLDKSPMGLRVSEEEERLGADFVEHELTSNADPSATLDDGRPRTSTRGYGVRRASLAAVSSFSKNLVQAKGAATKWRTKARESSATEIPGQPSSESLRHPPTPADSPSRRQSMAFGSRKVSISQSLSNGTKVGPRPSSSYGHRPSSTKQVRFGLGLSPSPDAVIEEGEQKERF